MVYNCPSKQVIVEESSPDETQGGRARRGVVDSQGGFAIGAKKEKRVIEPYKYWRVDNKEKNKKRKMMAGKLWKGRKRPKLDSLTPDEEVGLNIDHYSEIFLSLVSPIPLHSV